MKPLITIHYADGRESESREMTDEEIAQAFPDGIESEQADDL